MKQKKIFFEVKVVLFFRFGHFLPNLSNRPYYCMDHPNAKLDLCGAKSGQIKKITPPYEVKKNFF